jgi:Rrf2 family protein
MVHLAGLPPSARVSRGDLSIAADCPEQFLAKVLQSLTRAGLVVSHRGNTGGFELDELHRSASILEVIEAIEGPIRLNLCLTSDHACTRQTWCPAHNVWGDAQDAMVAVLRAATIDDLARRATLSRQPVAGILIEEHQWN